MNIAPPGATTRWFKLIGVELGNPTDEYPHGDTVQTCTVWEAPAPSEGITGEQMREILEQIERGLPHGSKYSAAYNAKRDTAAWGVIQDLHPHKTDEQCKAMIKEMVKAGRFGIGETKGDNYRKRPGIISVKTAVETFD